MAVSAADRGDPGQEASAPGSGSDAKTPIPVCIVNATPTTVELTIQYRGRADRLAIAPGNRDTPSVVSGFAANTAIKVEAYPLGATVPTMEKEVPLLPRIGLTLLITNRTLRVLRRGIGAGCGDRPDH